MATYLHTMLRITDPEQSRSFYEALGFTFSRDMDIVRNGELEATNYFYSLGDDENVLELTFNHDGRTYELGTGYGHIAIGVDDLDSTLDQLKGQGIEPVYLDNCGRLPGHAGDQCSSFAIEVTVRRTSWHRVWRSREPQGVHCLIEG